MGKPCKYCSQSDTHKDIFGFCKKYNCFERSGIKDKINELLKERDWIEFFSKIPTYKRNQFDRVPYNPKQEKINYINKEIFKLIND